MQVVSLHKLKLFPTELNVLIPEAATGARGPSSGTFQHPGPSTSTNIRQKGHQTVRICYFSTPACLDQFSEIRGHGHDHGVLAPLLSPGLHVVDSNINEIIGTDPQVQLSAYIQLEGMDQVRSNRIVNLHVMDISHSVTGLPQRKTSVLLHEKTEINLSRWSLSS